MTPIIHIDPQADRGKRSMIEASPMHTAANRTAGVTGGGHASTSIVAYLSPVLMGRLCSIVPRIRGTTSQRELMEAARMPGTTMIVVDPLADRGSLVEGVIALCEQFPSIAVVVYTRLLPEVVPHLIQLARLNILDVVLAGYDDTLDRFIPIIEGAQANPLVRCVVEQLDPQLRHAPNRLQNSVHSIFRIPLRFLTASDLAADAGMPRRSLYRHLQLIGLNSPRLLVASGRAVRALAMLSDQGRTIREVAERLRYSRPEILADNVMALTGMSLREARRGFDTQALANTLVDRLRTAPADLVD